MGISIYANCEVLLLKFCWLVPRRRKTAVEVHSTLHLLFIKEGAPTTLQSDNGREFIADVIKKLAEEFKIRLVHGRPYHAQSQGQVENLCLFTD